MYTCPTNEGLRILISEWLAEPGFYWSNNYILNLKVNVVTLNASLYL